MLLSIMFRETDASRSWTMIPSEGRIPDLGRGGGDLPENVFCNTTSLFDGLCGAIIL